MKKNIEVKRKATELKDVSDSEKENVPKRVKKSKTASNFHRFNPPRLTSFDRSELKKFYRALEQYKGKLEDHNMVCKTAIRNMIKPSLVETIYELFTEEDNIKTFTEETITRILEKEMEEPSSLSEEAMKNKVKEI